MLELFDSCALALPKPIAGCLLQEPIEILADRRMPQWLAEEYARANDLSRRQVQLLVCAVEGKSYKESERHRAGRDRPARDSLAVDGDHVDGLHGLKSLAAFSTAYLADERSAQTRLVAKLGEHARQGRVGYAATNAEPSSAAVEVAGHSLGAS